MLFRSTDNLNRVTREHLTGLRVVRAYNAEDYQREKFVQANTELTENNLFANRVMAIMFPCMGLIMNGLSLSIYWIGAILINQAGVEDKIVLFSDMVVFINYAVQVVMSFMMLSMILIMLPRAAVSARRIVEVIETKPQIQYNEGEGLRNQGVGELQVEDVSFRYHETGDYVLRNISFTANQGETVAFIGATGSGKSTLVNLLLRAYDTTEGSIRIDGRPDRKITRLNSSHLQKYRLPSST